MHTLTEVDDVTLGAIELLCRSKRAHRDRLIKNALEDGVFLMLKDLEMDIISGRNDGRLDQVREAIGEMKALVDVENDY